MSAEIALQRRQLEQVVEHHLGISITSKLNDDAHSVAITLIANIRNSFQFFIIHHLCDALDQCRLIGLIRQLSNDHRVTIGATWRFNRLNLRHAAHGDRTTAA